MLMRRTSISVSMITMMFVAAFAATVMAQPPEGARRGAGGGLSRGTLIGLLRIEQVQKELKLSEEQLTKVGELVESLGTEMREQYAAAREITDREQQRAKFNELRDQFDAKAREKLQDLLPREQMLRLYQIRLQVRSVVESLESRYVASRLNLSLQEFVMLGRLGGWG
jgi:Spy/CpxP family protein refolding chaperone